MDKEKFKNAGRNDPCPCGSGKKYKKCCMSKMQRGFTAKVISARGTTGFGSMLQTAVELNKASAEESEQHQRKKDAEKATEGDGGDTTS